MNQDILSFCRLHDWGRCAKLANGIITNLFDPETGTLVSFSDSAALMEWAGY